MSRAKETVAWTAKSLERAIGILAAHAKDHGRDPDLDNAIAVLRATSKFRERQETLARVSSKGMTPKRSNS
jgi:hypothetical protein